MTSDARRTGAQILWEVLVREGVEVVFGYPGGAIMPAYDAILEYPIRHVLVRHEQGAAHMADGYARASGQGRRRGRHLRPGRHEPRHRHRHGDARFDPHGVHHRAGLLEGHRDRRLPGDGHHRRHAAHHEAQLPRHARRRTSRPRCAQAFYVARSGRPGPVLVDITKDAQQAAIDFVWDDRAGAPAGLPPRPQAAPRGRAARRRADRRRRAPDRLLPVTASSPPARAQLLREFAEKAGIPVASTLLGLGGFPASHPLGPRHDGHARRGVGQPGDPGGRPPHRARHALRRPRHRQARDLRPQGEEDPLSSSTRPRSTRTSASTWRSSATWARRCAPSCRRSRSATVARGSRASRR